MIGNMRRLKCAVPVILILLANALTGCIALPGTMPFGEKRFSESEASAAYKMAEYPESVDFRQYTAFENKKTEIDDTMAKAIIFQKESHNLSERSIDFPSV